MHNRLRPTPPTPPAGQENDKACLMKKEDSTHPHNFSPTSPIFFSYNLMPFLNIFLNSVFNKSLPIFFSSPFNLSNNSNPTNSISSFLRLPLKEYSLVTLDSKGRLTWVLAKRLQDGHTEILKIQKEVNPFFKDFFNAGH